MIRPCQIYLFFLLEANRSKIKRCIYTHIYIYIGSLIFNLTMPRYKLRSSAFILVAKPYRSIYANIFLPAYSCSSTLENDYLFSRIRKKKKKKPYRNVTRSFFKE